MLFVASILLVVFRFFRFLNSNCPAFVIYLLGSLVLLLPFLSLYFFIYLFPSFCLCFFSPFFRSLLFLKFLSFVYLFIFFLSFSFSLFLAFFMSLFLSCLIYSSNLSFFNYFFPSSTCHTRPGEPGARWGYVPCRTCPVCHVNLEKLSSSPKDGYSPHHPIFIFYPPTSSSALAHLPWKMASRRTTLPCGRKRLTK